MKKIFPFLFLLSFACEAQSDSAWHITGTKLMGALGSIDTPQTDSNPHDFYSDTIYGGGLNLKLSPEEIKALQGRGYPQHFGQPMPMPGFPSPYYEPFPQPKVLSLEEKLLLYADECWNDSTEDTWFRRYEYTPIDSFVVEAKIIYRKYIHRKPTFEGFIEWLRKKQ